MVVYVLVVRGVWLCYWLGTYWIKYQYALAFLVVEAKLKIDGNGLSKKKMET